MPGVKKTMEEWHKGKLHSGSKQGPIVPKTEKGAKQAYAIAKSETRRSKRHKKH